MDRCRSFPNISGPWLAVLVLPGLVLGTLGCENDAPAKAPKGAASASAAPSALTPELAAAVLARVGKREITLGEYAATLERMDEFERLRYQSPERRRKLLEEIIDVELLAEEAKRRGLDQRPETQQRIRQILRDELLRRVRRELPKPEELPLSEVRAYYDAHKADFDEPERRRVAHIAVRSRALAERLLRQAMEASPKAWGELVKQHSVQKDGDEPLELRGDLGIVSKPGLERGKNPKVPEPLRAAVFEISELGGVHDQVVEHGGLFHIVRLIGKSGARRRSFAEAERTIRLILLEQRLEKAEAAFEQKLRQRYTVQIDEKTLKSVQVLKKP